MGGCGFESLLSPYNQPLCSVFRCSLRMYWSLNLVVLAYMVEVFDGSPPTPVLPYASYILNSLFTYSDTFGYAADKI